MRCRVAKIVDNDDCFVFHLLIRSTSRTPVSPRRGHGMPCPYSLPCRLAIFVLPPVLLVAGHIVFGRRLDARYADLGERLQTGARQTMLASAYNDVSSTKQTLTSTMVVVASYSSNTIVGVLLSAPS